MVKNWIVFGWNQPAVGPLMFSVVMTHDDPLSCWKTLEVHMPPRKTSHSQGIRDELCHLKKSENMSMNNYMIKVRSLTDN